MPAKRLARPGAGAGPGVATLLRAARELLNQPLTHDQTLPPDLRMPRPAILMRLCHDRSHSESDP